MILGVGVDIVDNERVRGMLQRRGAEPLMARLLTPGERAYCEGKADPVPHIAVRLAAKEAAFKALAGTFEARAIGWQELEVGHDEHKRPILSFHGRALSRAEELGVKRTHLSMTHGDTSAVAMVVVEGS